MVKLTRRPGFHNKDEDEVERFGYTETAKLRSIAAKKTGHRSGFRACGFRPRAPRM